MPLSGYGFKSYLTNPKKRTRRHITPTHNGQGNQTATWRQAYPTYDLNGATEIRRCIPISNARMQFLGGVQVGIQVL